MYCNKIKNCYNYLKYYFFFLHFNEIFILLKYYLYKLILKYIFEIDNYIFIYYYFKKLLSKF